MKKNLLICFLVSSLIPLGLNGQNISYHYDGAGNRIERVIELKSATIPGSQNQQVKPLVEDLNPEQEILIYPNPTVGALSVRIKNAQNSTDAGEILITDMNGKVLFRKEVTSDLMRFDLSNNSAGLYLMKIRLNGDTIIWKIIKK